MKRDMISTFLAMRHLAYSLGVGFIVTGVCMHVYDDDG